ncbi:hypothetical protein [Micromonospora sp. MW-13]|uniref:WD40/YVTN/BNR-like repeat-containing protein n=1 Tax=Micromonospora sp. MW-13 TaxID=2094022 RepID=UPI000E44453F|nr:hypothetical protein [Micromonospora sp. MW-13]
MGKSRRRALSATLALILVGTSLAFGGASAGGSARTVWIDATGQPMDANGVRPDGVTETALVGQAAAAEAGWTSLGPAGGDISAIAASPVDHSIVLAGLAPGGSVGGGLFRSVDGGATWTKVQALLGKSVFAIEFTAAGTAYIGTMDGVWRSNDGGLTWAAKNLNIGVNDQVITVVAAPGNPLVLWAGIAGAFGTQKVNVMRSIDGGNTWTNRTPPFGGGVTSRAIGIAPDDPNTVIATFDNGQVWITTDGGTTWAERSERLPNGPWHDVVYDGSRLILGGGQAFQGQFLGVFESPDLGQTWTALHNDAWPVKAVDDVAVDPRDRNMILVATAGSGVHRSTDGGRTWQLTVGGTMNLMVRSVSFDPSDSQKIFVGTDARAVFRSTDGGSTFTQSSGGINEMELHSVHANPANPNELAIAFQGQNGGGVFSSLDGGKTWNLEPVPPTRYSAVRFGPDGTLHAISSGPSTVAPEGLYRRGPDGNWKLLGPDQGPLFESALTTVRFGKANPSLIVLGGADFGVAGLEPTVWRSLDRGQTWTKDYEGPGTQTIRDLEILDTGTDLELVASVDDTSANRFGGVIRSEDGGTSWFPSMIGLPGGRFMSPQLCAAASDPSTLYLIGTATTNPAVTAPLYRATGGGMTWQPTGWVGGALTVDLACDPIDGGGIYVAQQQANARVIRSNDGGATFTPFGTGLEGLSLPMAFGFAGQSRMLLASGKGGYAIDIPRG